MFKVQREEYINKTFRMPKDLVNRLEIIAQREKVSLNNLVVQCCKYSLENMIDSESDE